MQVGELLGCSLFLDLNVKTQVGELFGGSQFWIRASGNQGLGFGLQEFRPQFWIWASGI